MPASLPDADGATLAQIFRLLDDAYGDETWVWDPEHVRGAMDVVAGAVLVQHTTWTNAERALENMRAAGALDPSRLARMPDDALIQLVRVSGTPNVKARRLRAIARTIVDAGGLEALLALDRDDLRRGLLDTHGIGPETADAILLYAAGHRTFLIDAYTQRVFRRIGRGPASNSYDAWQRWFEDRLRDADAGAFQRMHAHIVLHGKAVCRTNPRCGTCPLAGCCDTGSKVLAAPKSGAAPGERG
ncbi:MAG: endonuclease [Dehalococcoidia bacterium]